jgi:hypothetical protein
MTTNCGTHFFRREPAAYFLCKPSLDDIYPSADTNFLKIYAIDIVIC